MTDTNDEPAQQYTITPTSTRYLTPEETKIHLGNRGALHVTVRDDRIYGGVYAVYLFPVRQTGRFISLRHTVPGEKNEDIEIGIILDLSQWPADAQTLVQDALKRHYFIHEIKRIHHVGLKFGFIELDVETDKGHRVFLMHWRGDCAVDYGRKGKIIIDVDQNRYLIPDINNLDPHERSEFERYIYW